MSASPLEKFIRAAGAYGQTCIVVPEAHSIIAFTAHDAIENILPLVWREILPNL